MKERMSDLDSSVAVAMSDRDNLNNNRIVLTKKSNVAKK
jgi:hypothetical protein